MFTDLDEVLDKLQQGHSELERPVIETTDSSEDVSDASPGERKVLSKRTYRMKKAWASDELA